MEIIEVIFGIGEGILAFIDLVSLVVDAVAWSKSRQNRRERRVARRGRKPAPPIAPWTWAYMVLTVIVVIATTVLIVRWLAR